MPIDILHHGQTRKWRRRTAKWHETQCFKIKENSKLKKLL